MAKEVFKYALDPFISYHFQLPEYYPELTPIMDKTLTENWMKLKDLLDCLRFKRYPHAKLREMLNEMDQGPVGPILRRIINRDLRCGVGPKTINKVFRGLIPSFDIQLATQGNVEDLEFPVFVEPKYDGVRVIAIVEGKRATLYSRSGKIYSNFQKIEEAIEAQVNSDDLVFDGEVISTNFQALMQIAQRKENNESTSPIEEGLKYVVFDCLTLKEFVEKKCSKGLHGRRDRIFKYLEPDPKGTLMVSPCAEAHSRSIFEWMYDKTVSLGFEGVMVKTSAPYKFKRSKDWLKFKPLVTEDLKIVGFEEGSGKYEGMLGAIIVEKETYDEEKTKVVKTQVRVGTGFTDFDRVNIWKHKGKFMGTIIEVGYQDVTNDGSLRFPRFIRNRFDK